ncbi:Restriction endonuclease subunit R [Exiguobacterium sp. 8A]|uniref:DEAD/DEAH box helicase family protein n=1 Tax=Exiguobacterium sp. 8A TaxID=2653139 RepID=UPI0012F120A3|nr:DEAD/DEAH box helicase family protein [Exiguobacterium sp. 8A]VXC00755.1 Restriction endonuclease subunit R [Exiguobacterium sp. 8A]
MSKEILHTRIEERFKDIFDQPPEVPDYLQKNLNHTIRPYQEEALRHLIYTQRSPQADVSFQNQLFHMATGSGKTLILAASILYLYQEHGYQNFLFFADSDAIVKKTRNNLTNSTSPKYLFKPEGIVLDGNKIQVQTVDTFPHQPAPNTIYLKVTSVQSLHNNLMEPKENEVTFETLEEMNIVMLADEAHHYFAETRRNQKSVTQEEAKVRSWERTIEQLLSLNPKNRLLGFSATLNLENEFLFEKLQNRIVYQYDLKRFMESGYSKNVVLLQTNEEDHQKMLHSVLLSQYRKYIAKDYGIDLKPIILFKSNNISKSIKTHRSFSQIVENLSISQLQKTIEHGLAVYKETTSIWNKMFKYYEDKDLINVIRDIQWDFTDKNLMNANDSKFLSVENTLLLNTLEEADNPIRAIFAVAKLNEGWDVLNLYDIVRISEGATGTRKTTDSEAQLIGRGARYYPFIYENNQSYQRRFDLIDSDLKAIETLHYHTINESSYIQNLSKSLETANIQVKEDGSVRYDAIIKPKFKRSDLYQTGKIYINQVVPTTPEDYQSFNSYNVASIYETDLETAKETEYKVNGETTTTRVHTVELSIDKVLWQKAIQRNPFYHFSNLKKYIPSISSADQFIESENFLSGVKILLTLPIGLLVEQLTPKQKLVIIEKFLFNTQNKIRLNYMKEKGTPLFYGVHFQDVIKDYYVQINQVRGKVTTEVVRPKNMREHDWYIFNQAIVNGLEQNMIEFINSYMDELNNKYDEVYLIRNERKIKIVEIDGTRGFMPDFLLYLKDEETTYQVFLEPKNKLLYEQDKWKEDFLLALSKHQSFEVLSENEEVRLIGVKFYMAEPDKKLEFQEDFKNKLLN